MAVETKNNSGRPAVRMTTPFDSIHIIQMLILPEHCFSIILLFLMEGTPRYVQCRIAKQSWLV